MIRLPLKKLAEIVGADAAGVGKGEFRGVTIDSRKPCGGMLFVALEGPNFDGHRFVEAAHAAGAVAALVERRLPLEIGQIVVEDCKRALARLANYWRHQCGPCVIALTGSNGKTTVKEMLCRILSSQAATHATRGNLNNDIGVPLTLFELAPGHDYAIIEMGANHRGEIANLAAIAEPDIVYVNNVAAAHLAGFGDLQGVIEAKGELYAWCSTAQKALFNVDEAASAYWQEICAAETRLSCGLGHTADVGARYAQVETGLEVEFSYAGTRQSCKIDVMGEHNARNALAAVSLALLAGIGFERAVAGLAGFAGVKGRLQMLPGPAGSRLLDDSYNANPDSLQVGIRVLCALEGSAWLALGDMAELGDDAPELHRRAARFARDQGVEKMFALGAMSCAASEEFGDAGFRFDSVEDMVRVVRPLLHDGVNLLIKGSRAAGMERLVAMLNQPVNGGEADAV